MLKCIERIRFGSSPHVRGTWRREKIEIREARFIPARAGNISSDSLIFSPCSVHPRTCGEHSRRVSQKRMIPGSSPHVRGTWIVQRRFLGYHRFIPARAGNIFRSSSAISRQSVHPRTCGEHIHEASLHAENCGSSPHVRGTFLWIFHQILVHRFIPARAGNILPEDLRKCIETVHPRTCGEHQYKNW